MSTASSSTPNRFPWNRGFAFTIFDDTDESTVHNTAPVYRLLTELGFRVTKSVWPLPADAAQPYGGESLSDSHYLEFVQGLQRDGHEIALHNVRNFDSPREVVELGLRRFEELLGTPPRVHANHYFNRDNLYWGGERLSTTLARLSYRCGTAWRQPYVAEGHCGSSRYFWGDLCRTRIVYVRNFVFGEVNLDAVNPTMPYHDPTKPFVNYWFSSSEGSQPQSFCATLSEANQDRLEAEGGVCIMYTHFGAGFFNGELNPRFAALMRRLARKNGWFVPVGELLDHLRAHRKRAIGRNELAQMERRWLLHKMRVGPS